MPPRKGKDLPVSCTNGSTLPHGDQSSCTLECIEGYYAVGEQPSCNAGKFDAGWITCKEKSCDLSVSSYIGCYVDRRLRDLSKLVGHKHNRDSCVKLCRKEGYLYAGLQWYGQCFCGDTYGRYEKATNEDECNTPCAAGESYGGERCGGRWRNSIYKVTGFPEIKNIAVTPENCSAGSLMKPGTICDYSCDTNFTLEGDLPTCTAGTYDPGNLTCEPVDTGDCTLDSVAMMKIRLPKYAEKTSKCTTYIGCFKDSGKRDLTHFVKGSYNRETCIEACKQENYLYAGLQFFQQCFCGNSYGSYGASPESECRTECRLGPKGTMCGGAWRNSIYSTTLTISNGSHCDISCKDGYHVVGEQPTCIDGKIGHGSLICMPKSCIITDVDVAKSIPGGCVEGSELKHDSSCKISCQEGYHTSGVQPSCNAGTFDIGTVTCVPNDCTVLNVQKPENGNSIPINCQNGSVLSHDETCSLTCKDGYTLKGKQPSCSAGRFDPGWITCTPSSCLISSSKYIGCFKDKRQRDLKHWARDTKNAKVWDSNRDKCITYCKANGYAYAALQWKGVCMCDNVYGKYGRYEESRCNMACRGGASFTNEKCGGIWANSIYAVGVLEKFANSSDLPTEGLCSPGSVLKHGASCSLSCVDGYALSGKQPECLFGTLSTGTLECKQKVTGDCKLAGTLCMYDYKGIGRGSNHKLIGHSDSAAACATSVLSADSTAKGASFKHKYNNGKNCYANYGETAVNFTKHSHWMSCIYGLDLAPMNGSMGSNCANGSTIKKDAYCNVKCDEGYRLEGTLPQCQNGSMVIGTAVCVPKDCNISGIERPENGAPIPGNCRNGGTLKHLDQCKLLCQEGYHAVGEQPSCAAGTFTVGTITCEPNDCTVKGIKNVENGNVIPDGCSNGSRIKHGQQCSLTCMEGFTLNGKQPACNAGKFDRGWITCTPSPCFISESKYMGCFKDKGDRALKTLVRGSLNRDSCIKECKKLGHSYAGLQWMGQCWCGESYDKYGTSKQCNRPCRNPSYENEICGGGWANSVYKVSGLPIVANASSVSADCPVNITIKHGKTCSLKCKDGYALSGKQPSCDRGTITQGSIVCTLRTDNDCKVMENMPLPANGRFDKSCSAPFTLKHTQTCPIICDKNFAFSGKTPTCDNGTMKFANFKAQKIETPNRYYYKSLGSVKGLNSVTFQVQAKNDVHIALSEDEKNRGNKYEIVIGGWGNRQSVLRLRNQGPSVYTTREGPFLDADKMLDFWISWNDKKLRVGRGVKVGSGEFMSTRLREDIDIKFMMICTGWGATGVWKVNFASSVCKPTGCHIKSKVGDGAGQIIVPGNCLPGSWIPNGFTCQLRCEDGYSLKGEQPECNAGFFNSGSVTCVPKSCTIKGLAKIKNGSFGRACKNGSSLPHGSKLCTAQCDDGYTFKGIMPSCHAGRFNPGFQMCREKACVIESVKYFGCYKDTRHRDLEHRVRDAQNHSSTNSNRDDCVKECRTLGYQYAGVQFYGECWCGNNPFKYGKGEETDCNTPCRSNSKEFCGGTWRNSIYSTNAKLETPTNGAELSDECEVGSVIPHGGAGESCSMKCLPNFIPKGTQPTCTKGVFNVGSIQCIAQQQNDCTVPTTLSLPRHSIALGNCGIPNAKIAHTMPCDIKCEDGYTKTGDDAICTNGNFTKLIGVDGVRYVRISSASETNSKNGTWELFEVEFFAMNSNTKLNSVTIHASSFAVTNHPDNSGVYPATRLIDGNPSTSWSGNYAICDSSCIASGGQWVIFDLGSNILLEKIVLTQSNSTPKYSVEKIRVNAWKDEESTGECEIRCDDGYERKGTLPTCHAGTFNRGYITCAPSSCVVKDLEVRTAFSLVVASLAPSFTFASDSLPILDSKCQQGTEIEFGESCDLKCPLNRKVSGEQPRCDAGGNFKSGSVSCEAEPCLVPTTIQTRKHYRYELAGNVSQMRSILVKVTAKNDAHIALSEGTFHSSKKYEIVIGGWSNSKSVIRLQNQGRAEVVSGAKPFLNKDVAKDFWISWNDSFLRVGRGTTVGTGEFMSVPLVDGKKINYILVATGWGATGNWVVGSGSLDWSGTLTNGNVECQGVLQHGERCNVKCKDNYAIAGEQPYCDVGNFKKGNLTCTLKVTKDCIIQTEGILPSNGDKGSCIGVLKNNSTCKFECNPGYKLQGDDPKCIDGTLHVGLALCMPMNCTIRGMERPENGAPLGKCKNGEELSSESRCELTCLEGYHVSGEQPKCSAGTFSIGTISCEPNVCTVMDMPEPIFQTYTVTDYSLSYDSSFTMMESSSMFGVSTLFSPSIFHDPFFMSISNTLGSFFDDDEIMDDEAYEDDEDEICRNGSALHSGDECTMSCPENQVVRGEAASCNAGIFSSGSQYCEPLGCYIPFDFTKPLNGAELPIDCRSFSCANPSTICSVGTNVVAKRPSSDEDEKDVWWAGTITAQYSNSFSITFSISAGGDEVVQKSDVVYCPERDDNYGTEGEREVPDGCGSYLDHGESCTLTCLSNYSIDGDQPWCDAGVFHSGSITCSPEVTADCKISSSDIIAPENGSVGSCIVSTVVKNGSSCELKCNDGYELSGEHPSCSSGTLSDSTVLCEPMQCLVTGLSAPKNGNDIPGHCANGSMIEHEENCSITCLTGYHPSGVQPSCSAGIFNIGSIQCVPNACTVRGMSNIENGITIPYSCSNGSIIKHGEKCILVKVTAKNDAHIALSEGTFHSSKKYEIVIGGWSNSKSVIRLQNQGRAEVVSGAKPFLNKDVAKDFWISWNDSFLRVGRGTTVGTGEFMSVPLVDGKKINYILVATGWGATGNWVVGSGSLDWSGTLTNGDINSECKPGSILSHGASCNFSCKSTHAIEGQQASCSFGHFAKGDVSCTTKDVNKDCTIPSAGLLPIANGFIGSACSPNLIINNNFICPYHCYPGYELKGDGPMCVDGVLTGTNQCSTIKTNSKYKYTFVQDLGGIVNVKFKVTAKNDAHIGLSEGKLYNSEKYEIVIGGWSNSKSVIRFKNQGRNEVVSTAAPFVDQNLAKDFWMSWDNGMLKVGRGTTVGTSDFMSVPLVDDKAIRYMLVSTGWGSSGSFEFCRSPIQCEPEDCIISNMVLPTFESEPLLGSCVNGARLAHGSSCKRKCRTGYSIHGEQPSCTAGRFSQGSVYCKPNDCIITSNVLHRNMTNFNTTDPFYSSGYLGSYVERRSFEPPPMNLTSLMSPYLFTTMLSNVKRIPCLPGTRMKHGSYINGWPSCKPQNCFITPEFNVTNAVIECPNPLFLEHGKSCPVRCKAGYALYGQFPSCFAGRFSPGNITCTKEVSFDCSLTTAVEPPLNGKLSSACVASATLKNGASCDFECEDGYDISGQQPFCLEGVIQNAKGLTCNPKKCRVKGLEMPENSYESTCFNHDLINHDEECTIYCKEGYRASGEHPKCQFGRFDRGTVTCEPNSCTVENFQLPSNALYISVKSTNLILENGAKFPHNSDIQISCEKGYAPTGLKPSCRAGDFIYNDLIQCSPLHCIVPTDFKAPLNANPLPPECTPGISILRHGDSCKLSCPNDKSLSMTTQPTCEYGIFSPGDVTCEAIDNIGSNDCRVTNIVPPENGVVGPECAIGNALKKDEECNMKCNEGFTLSGAQPKCVSGTLSKQDLCPNPKIYKTGKKYEYQFTRSVIGHSRLIFKVQAKNDVHISLGDEDEKYEIVIGGWGGNKSVIRLRPQGRAVVEDNNGSFLDENMKKDFWIEWDDTFLKVGRGLTIGSGEFMRIKRIGINIHDAMISTGWGSEGIWEMCTAAVECKAVGCTVPLMKSIQHSVGGNCHPNSVIMEGTICEVDCEEGFSPVGSLPGCKNGIFYPGKVTCQEKKCIVKGLIKPPHAKDFTCEVGEEVEPNEIVCEIECEEGYIIKGEQPSCNAGVFNGGSVSCEPKSCDAISPFTYLGCYKDGPLRDLSHRRVDENGRAFNPSNAASCVEYCREKGYTYAGTQWYGECWCGNSYGKYKKADERNCNTPCRLDPTELCGGGYHNSVYEVSSLEIENGFMECNSLLQHGDKCNVRCDNGFALSGAEEPYCHLGTFRRGTLKCTKEASNDCPIDYVVKDNFEKAVIAYEFEGDLKDTGSAGFGLQLKVEKGAANFDQGLILDGSTELKMTDFAPINMKEKSLEIWVESTGNGGSPLSIFGLEEFDSIVWSNSGEWSIDSFGGKRNFSFGKKGMNKIDHLVVAWKGGISSGVNNDGSIAALNKVVFYRNGKLTGSYVKGDFLNYQNWRIVIGKNGFKGKIYRVGIYDRAIDGKALFERGKNYYKRFDPLKKMNRLVTPTHAHFVGCDEGVLKNGRRCGVECDRGYEKVGAMVFADDNKALEGKREWGHGGETRIWSDREYRWHNIGEFSSQNIDFHYQTKVNKNYSINCEDAGGCTVWIISEKQINLGWNETGCGGIGKSANGHYVQGRMDRDIGIFDFDNCYFKRLDWNETALVNSNERFIIFVRSGKDFICETGGEMKHGFLNCKPKDCVVFWGSMLRSELILPGNCKDGNVLRSGEVCDVTCPEGYRVVGKVGCNEGIFESNVKCIPNDCVVGTGMGPFKEDECSEGNVVKSGEKCTLDCEEGYQAKGSEHKCMAGRFEGSAKCVPKNCTIQNYQYIGCFRDGPRPRDLSHRSVDENGKSINLSNAASCVEYCRGKGYVYAGTQWYGECWCGNSYGSYGEVDEKRCDRPCKLDPTEFCGGGYHNSIYKIEGSVWGTGVIGVEMGGILKHGKELDLKCVAGNMALQGRQPRCSKGQFDRGTITCVAKGGNSCTPNISVPTNCLLLSSACKGGSASVADGTICHIYPKEGFFLFYPYNFVGSGCCSGSGVMIKTVISRSVGKQGCQSLCELEDGCTAFSITGIGGCSLYTSRLIDATITSKACSDSSSQCFSKPTAAAIENLHPKCNNGSMTSHSIFAAARGCFTEPKIRSFQSASHYSLKFNCASYLLHGESCDMMCPDGYTLEATTMPSCINGVFQIPKSRCKPLACTVVGVDAIVKMAAVPVRVEKLGLDNAITSKECVDGLMIQKNESCRYICTEPGYNTRSEPGRCNAGVFTPGWVTCTASSCEINSTSLDLPANSVVSKCTAGYRLRNNESCNISCAQGYALSGKQPSCLAGILDLGTLQCSIKASSDCTIPESISLPEHANFGRCYPGAILKNNESCNFECARGYTVKGKSPECNSGNLQTFTGDLEFKCVGESCLVVNRDRLGVEVGNCANGVTIPNGFVCKQYCANAAMKISGQQPRCVAGVYDPGTISCQHDSCVIQGMTNISNADLETVEKYSNGQILKNGESTEIECNSGYDAIGEQPSCINGTFNKGSFRCKASSCGMYTVNKLGCFRDKERDRDLTKLVARGRIRFFKTKCARRCFKKGFKFAGIQAGGICYCGNSYGKHSKSKEANCNIPCEAKRAPSGEICGGKLWNSVYEINGFIKPANTKVIARSNELSTRDPCFDGILESGETCNIRCKDGYSVSGIQPSCNAGVFNSGSLTCNASSNSDCVIGTIPIPENGYIGSCIKDSRVKDGSSCFLKCISGFTISGQQPKCTNASMSSGSISCTAAKCTVERMKPFENGNDLPGACSNGSQLNDGDICTLTCQNGYHAVGEQPKCSAGRFSIGTIKCIPNACTVKGLGIIANGSYSHNNGDILKKGEVITLKCDTGYESHGELGVCSDAGLLETYASCKPKSCHVTAWVDLVKNGGGLQNVGEVPVSCRDGAILKHNEICGISCENNSYALAGTLPHCSFGEFSIGNFSCVAKQSADCTVPAQGSWSNIANGKVIGCVSGTIIRDGGKCHVECNRGYEHSGSAPQCSSGTFNGGTSSCVPKGCEIVGLRKPYNGEDLPGSCSNGATLSHQSSCNLLCKPNFEKSGVNPSCEAGIFSRGSVSCTPRDAIISEMPVVPFSIGWITVGGGECKKGATLSHGSVCLLRCIEGYSIRGEMPKSFNGVFHKGSPSCKANSCEVTEELVNNQSDGRRRLQDRRQLAQVALGTQLCKLGAVVKHQAYCQLQCPPNYALSGAYTYCNCGSWTVSSVKCSPKQTGDCVASGIKAPIGAVADPGCADGFLIANGSTCSIQPKSGYTISGQQPKCTNGVLSSGSLVIKKSGCTVSGLSKPENARNIPGICSNGSVLNNGASCMLTCLDGYHISGKQPDCNTGIFDVGTVTCEPDACIVQGLKALENGTFNYENGDTVPHGEMLVATCDSGYTMKGQLPSCSAGRFDRGYAQCKANNCTIPSNFTVASGVKVTSKCGAGGTLPHGESCLLECVDVTHTLLGVQPSCSAGTFNTGNITCQSATTGDCATLDINSKVPANAVAGVRCKQGGSLKNNLSCDIRCNDGYEFKSGKTTQPSCNNGTLSNGDLECIPSACTVTGLSKPANGNELPGACSNESIIEHGTSCSLTCKEGYHVSGVQPSCMTGTFTIGTITCLPNSCSVKGLGTIANGRYDECLNGSVVSHGKICSIICDTGYKISGQPPSCSAGNFNPGHIQCVPQDCTTSHVPIPTNGGPLPQNCKLGLTMQHGERCNLICLAGFAKSGSDPYCNLGVFNAGNVTCTKSVNTDCTVSGLIAPANGSLGTCINGTVISSGCIKTCDPGFTLNGSQPSCNAGVFHAGSVNCTPNDCMVDMMMEKQGLILGSCINGSTLAHQTSCSLSCVNGYHAVGLMPSCLAGAFSVGTMTCEPDACIVKGLKTVANGSYDKCQNGSSMNHGDKCSLTCNPGYSMNGQLPSCSAGRFDRGYAQCKANNCTIPSNFTVASGVKVTSKCGAGGTLPHGESCLLECVDVTHTLLGVQPSCSAGTFNTGNITCQSATTGDCATLDINSKVPANAVAGVRCKQGGSLKNNLSCDIRCNDGYEFKSGKTTQPSCNNGTLSNGDLECIPSACTVTGLSKPKNSYESTLCLNGTVLSHGSSCTIVCKEGYRVSGVQPSCSAGKFNSGTITCEPDACTVEGMDVKPNLIIPSSCTNGKTLPFGTQCKLSCAANFELIGAQPSCKALGIWEPGSPLCVPVCKIPSDHGKNLPSPCKTGDRLINGTSCDFSCVTALGAETNCTSTVLNTSVFVPGTVRCLPNSCTIPQTFAKPQNGNNLPAACAAGQTISSGYSCTLSCLQGFTIRGKQPSCNAGNFNPGSISCRSNSDTTCLTALPSITVAKSTSDDCNVPNLTISNAIVPEDCQEGMVLANQKLCNIRCEVGYFRSGSLPSCASGTFSSNTVACSGSSCKVENLASPQVGTLSCQNGSILNHSAKCPLICPSSEYEVVGDEYTCTASTVASTNPPICTFKSCTVSINIINSLPPSQACTNGKKIAHGLSCSITCAANHTFVGDMPYCEKGNFISTGYCKGNPCYIPSDFVKAENTMPNHCDVGDKLESGESCNLQCIKDHVISGSQPSCSAGTFSKGSLKCTPTKCKNFVVSAPLNGSIGKNCLSSSVLNEGESCEIECNPGYAKSSSGAAPKCQQGVLTENTISCVGISCTVKNFIPPPLALPVPSACSDGATLAHQQKCDIKCQDGLTATGSASCLAGNFTSNITCSPSSCQISNLPKVLNGNTTCEMTATIPHNSSCLYTCQSGYYLTTLDQPYCSFGNFVLPQKKIECVPFLDLQLNPKAVCPRGAEKNELTGRCECTGIYTGDIIYNGKDYTGSCELVYNQTSPSDTSDPLVILLVIILSMVGTMTFLFGFRELKRILAPHISKRVKKVMPIEEIEVEEVEKNDYDGLEETLLESDESDFWNEFSDGSDFSEDLSDFDTSDDEWFRKMDQITENK
eukprot:g1215.t1